MTVAGLPVLATGFRPLNEASLLYNPFHVFTSLFHFDLIKDDALSNQVKKILSLRSIFTSRCVELIEKLEKSPDYPWRTVDELVHEALDTFRWHETFTVDIGTYKELEASHPLIADIVCFRGPHVNHLTPRVLDIDSAQAAMQIHGQKAKSSIEAPRLVKTKSSYDRQVSSPLKRILPFLAAPSPRYALFLFPVARQRAAMVSKSIES